MFLNFKKRQCLILIILTNVYTMSSIGIFMLIPFYPKIAEERGITPIYYSGVFSSYNFAWFLVSPFCGALVRLVDPYVIVKTSIFIIGVTNILFGFIDKIYDASIFLWLSSIFRIVEAYGFATFTVSAFCIAAKEFPNDIGTIIGIFETGEGVGLCLGPAIGGVLYMYGGFELPFIALGIFIVFVGFISLFLNSSDTDFSLNLRIKDIIILLKKTEVLFVLWSLTTGSITIGLNSSNLEPHVRTFLNLSPSIISFFFALGGASFSISSISWGKLCDWGKPPQKLMCIGTFIMGISLMFLGPAPYFKIPLNIPLCLFGFVIFGVGSSALVVIPLFCLHKITRKMGFPDDFQTYGLVSSIFNSFLSFGFMTGAMVGALFSEYIGLAWCYQILLLFYALLITGTLFYDFIYKDNDFPNKNRTNQE
ncbi:UNVERIFIED_CONTAM: hypothetical protein RMT77_012292 [Armadillidium vulgare]